MSEVLVTLAAAETLPRRALMVAAEIARKTNAADRCAWINQAEIARTMEVEHSVINRAVRRLESAGYGEFTRSRDGGWFRWSPGRLEQFRGARTQGPRMCVM